MDQRAHVYSPLQNIAIWLASWLHGHIATDECVDALRALGGDIRIAGVQPDAPGNTLELLRTIRRLAAESLDAGEPVIQLVLCGPGEAPGLRAGSPSARATLASGMGALVLPTPDRFRSHVVVPVDRGGGLACEIFAEAEPLPAQHYLSPGEADLLLADATRSAAQLIDAIPHVTPDLPNPRLTVGTLTDFYDTPGLPFSTPPRAAKLFARADRVAAIIETVSSHVGDHSLDPVLLPLMRNVRMARTAGVSYAVHELARC
ncbi:hypothetical protein HW450_00785 [Corynebacterium hindlerae]|uniref:Uncharacterized protein n=1 Tax=Corynebacterium hindlerae TaxID=699041 RepID=A0A7G5FFE2_9CORY|nr:hypothetical protein [Corynebacterium hindlerae]QMV85333.1 hypothetical protein HW450_00785 [Corynebacterium hindlerae]